MTQLHIHSDQYLINGLRENNSSIIQEIYDKYSSKIYNWVKKNNGSQEHAEDIFQESLIDIYRKSCHEDFFLSCPFDAFLFIIARNKWLSYLKNNNPNLVTNTSDLEYKLTDHSFLAAEKVIQYENQYQLFLQKLEALQDGCKELLKLSWSGLNMEQVAHQLKVTYAYVRKKKSLCMAKLIDSIKNSTQYQQLSFIKK